MRSIQTNNLPTVSGWLGRVIRFDFSAFEEIRSDPTATTPAISVVLGASILAGLGSWIWALNHSRLLDAGEVFVKSVVLGSIFQLLAWFLWVYIAYLVLARVFGTHADFYEMVRVMGFAFVAVALNVLVAIDMLAVPFGVTSWAITVLITNVAMSSATTADSQQITWANIIGFAFFAIVMGIMANVAEAGRLGGLAPGLFFFALDF